MMNEPEYCEIDVTARATLEKRTVVIGSGMHPCVEGETEPDGTRSYVTRRLKAAQALLSPAST